MEIKQQYGCFAKNNYIPNTLVLVAFYAMGAFRSIRAGARDNLDLESWEAL